MNVSQRIRAFITGLGMLIFSLLLFIDPEGGYKVIALVLGASFLIRGIRLIIYYIYMARHMVGGKAILYRGILILDLGLFTLSLTDVPRLYVISYLVLLHGFTGMVGLFHALEEKKYKARSWRWDFTGGLVNLIMAVLCLVMIRSLTITVWIYSAGLLYSAVNRIGSAFRKSAIVYIQ